ncbi:MAG: penicillin-binding protein 2 [Alphaproteobacteria bacterium]
MTPRIRMDGVGKSALETARTRLLVGGGLVAAAFLAVGVRLVDVSVIETPEQTRIASQRTVAGPIQMTRAEIVDRNGVLLATSLDTASLYANPHKVPNAAAAARRLAEVLPERSVAELTALLASDRNFVWLERNLTPREQYEVNRLGIPGLDFQREQRRVYPNGPLAAHVLGFTDIDNAGIAGVEQSFDDSLKSRRNELALAVDIRIQQVLRHELALQIEKFKAIGGGGLVLDARTGEIVAMVSLPDFDPNMPGSSSEDERFNRMTLGIYELGSVFKIFNHALALESGVATITSRYDATKPIRVGRFTINDYHPEKRWLTLPEIFKHSSNIGSAKMALDAGGAAQKKFLSDLGLLRRTSIELPEQGLPMYPATWRDVNTMTISYGHGIAISPLHMATAVAAIVNGGILHPPTLIRRKPEDAVPGTRVVSAETSRAMRSLLRLVVEDGTGRNASAPGYLVGGKTGTAEKQVNGIYKRKALISSFVAAFPIHAPRYVVLAMLDEPKGIKESFGFATAGWTAAPVVSRVIARTAPLLGIAPYEESAPEIVNALALPGETTLELRRRRVASN